MRLMTYFEQHGFDYEVYAAVYPRIAAEEPKGATFLENFTEVLLARHRFQTIVDSKAFFYVTLLQNMLTMEEFRRQFVSLPRSPFIPDKRGLKQVQGNVLDLSSPFGLFARVSLLGTLSAYNQELKANMNLEERIYSDFGRIKYKKDFDAKVKSYTSMEAEYLAILKEVFKLMFKKDTQKVFFEWLYCLVVGNQMRAKLGTRLSGAVNNTISHDGLMMNVYESMLDISKGILDRNQSVWTKIDPEYFRYSDHARLCQYEPLNNKKDGGKMEVEGKEFGTVTEFFFLTMELLHVGVVPTLLNFKEINETKERIEKELDKMGKSHPMYAQGERELQRLKVKFFQYYLVVMDDLKVKASVRLLDMVLFLLPRWLGVDYAGFRQGRLQMGRPQLTHVLPEFLLNDVFEYHQFFCRIKENYVQLLGADHINSIVNVTCLLLAEDGVSTNPYVCANYIELLFYFLMLNKAVMSEVLGGNEVAASNMTPGLVRFYSDIAFTGSSHQFYSKYKYRFYANKIFTTLWQHEVYRKALRDISRTEQFERFINMIMTDSTYCFDEITEKYDKLKEYDMKRANNSMTPEDLRSEEMISGAMTGNLQQTVSNLKLLKSLSNWSPETFHAEAFLTSAVPLFNNMLSTLVDPTSFANDRSIVSKYKFEKEFMLADLLTIYVNLNIKDILVNEIIRDLRYYKKENFTNALQKAANENCADENVLERFEALIGQLSNACQDEDEDETIFGEIPDKYLCEIIGTVPIG
jgi:ubiquitin conjugation factor E4 B